MIELLFVITVMAVMAVVGVRFLQSGANETKLKLAAQEMRNWLQAGIIYEAAHGSWPITSDELAKAYPQMLHPTNPWGLHYTTTLAGDQQSNFAVRTLVPNNQLAVRLASLLGQSEVDNNNVVVAFAGAKSIPELNENLLVKEIRTVEGVGSGLGQWANVAADKSGGDSKINKRGHINEAKIRNNRGRILVPVPQCPVGMNPGYEISLSGFQKGCNQVQNWNPFSSDFLSWSCTGSTNVILPYQTSNTRSVRPYQRTTNPISVNGQQFWEMWINTRGKTISVEGRFGLAERDVPNFSGGVTYMTYCQGEARA